MLQGIFVDTIDLVF